MDPWARERGREPLGTSHLDQAEIDPTSTDLSALCYSMSGRGGGEVGDVG
jgi:hypothetical protein